MVLIFPVPEHPTERTRRKAEKKIQERRGFSFIGQSYGKTVFLL
jgi:hypothetical protein